MVLAVVVLFRNVFAFCAAIRWRSRCLSEKLATATVVKSFALKPNPKLPCTGFLAKVKPTPGVKQAVGGSGAQAQCVLLNFQLTQDGPQTVSGAQHQPQRL